MGPVIGETERRARLGTRHSLASPATTVEEAVSGVVAFHSSDPASVYLSAWARVEAMEVADLEAALYDRRSLVRLLGMRRTLFVVPRELAVAVDAGATQALLAPQRARVVRMLAEQGVDSDPAAWLERVEAATMAALAARPGPATARELTADVPELGVRLSYGEGTTWAATGGVSTRVLFLLATAGRVLRARPMGTWVSGQYRWALTEDWLGQPFGDLGPADARATLARAWLHAFGPATLADLKWWTGWTVKAAKEALVAVEAVEVELRPGREQGWLLGDDLEPVPSPGPWVALLPGLDPTVMGWKERGWYLGPRGGRLFDTNGNAGPTVWVDGGVVGGWAQVAGGEVVTELLEDPGSECRQAIEAEAARLTGWLGGVRVTPRFRTPLEREITGRLTSTGLRPECGAIGGPSPSG